MMDRPGADPEVLEDDLRNLRIINRHFGGLRALRKAVLPMAERVNTDEKITILDLATGSGDQPVALVRAFRQIGGRLHITAVDRNEVMLATARKHAAGMKEITFERHDIMNLPYDNGSFDIVTCSLAIHHFSRENGVKLLREMNRISKIGFVVNDLSRGHIAALTAWIYTRLTTTNPMTRYDSVISVLRAFTKDELIAMVGEAGVGPTRIYTAPLFRLLAVREK
jgi:ubiquinone/menaquinone biosynthesis C-methylase UbiE